MPNPNVNEMSTKDFDKYLESLDDTAYDALIQKRIERLNDEQKVIAQAREVQRHERFKLIAKLKEADEDTNHMVFNALRDMDADECEHGRHYVKHCLACGEIDHLMFPELFDEDGFRIEEE